MTRPASHLPPAATCTFVLRLADGRYVSDPAGAAASCSIDNAYLWLWPLIETEEARDERVAAIAKRYPWIGAPTAVRSKA
jgi:hypothetical protein